MKQAITQALSDFIAALDFASLPEGVVDTVKVGFLDAIGVMRAGRDEPAVAALRQVLAGEGPGPCSVLLGEGRASAANAAWINGTAMHALDYDDTALRGHTSAVLVPAILAVGETVGATGRQMIAAYAAGYETWAELVRRDQGQHHAKGWHPTGIFGAVGAAAACACLLGCDAGQAAMALGLGATQGAGLMADFGVMAKPFHAGRSAHAGVMAALLAKAGMTAAPDALEHAQGFMAAVSPAGDIDFDAPVLAGKTWQLATVGLNIKQYPTCYCTHRAIDGMLDLLRAHPVQPGDVAEIRVAMSRRNATVLRNHRPRTGLEAKFSIEFVMAAAIVARRVGLAELTDAFVQRADIQQLIPKVSVDFSALPTDPLTGYAPHDEVIVRLKNGASLRSGPVSVVRGAYTKPLSPQELRGKFEDCMRSGGKPAPDAGIEALYRTLMHLESASVEAIRVA